MARGDQTSFSFPHQDILANYWPWAVWNIMVEHGFLWGLTSILSIHMAWHAVVLDIWSRSRPEEGHLGSSNARPAPKCVLWILSSMAVLLKVGMTACWPLYTMPSARDSSSLKVKKGHTKGSTPVLAVGQPVIMRSDSFCRAGSPIPLSKCDPPREFG